MVFNWQLQKTWLGPGIKIGIKEKGMKLTDLPLNTAARLREIRGNNQFVRRFYDLGFYPGCELRVRRKFGKTGPVVVALEATAYSMRRHEAEALIVQVLNE